jgi:hypothetical protein
MIALLPYALVRTSRYRVPTVNVDAKQDGAGVNVVVTATVFVAIVMTE